MRKFGMIGGFGPESTLDYYKRIMELYRQEIDSYSYPEIVINSMDINKLLKMVADEKWNELVRWIVDGINDLHKAGAEFGFISANTPHIVFDLVQERSPIPLISIVKETCKKVVSLNINKVALLGTRFTMTSKFYQEVFNKERISIIVPNEQDQEYIHSKLMNEIELGIFLDETRDGLLNIIHRLIETEAVEGVILGCTELPLILSQDNFGIPFINTTEVHVESIIRYCRPGV